MAQKDWTEVIQIITDERQDYFSDFISSDEIFLPNSIQVNTFKCFLHIIISISINFKKQKYIKGAY